jgi:predicted DNA-binding protein with PD1-like motif
MKYSEASLGKVYVLRLEDGDILHEEIEGFALNHQINAAAVIAVGGVDQDSELVVGPEQGRATPVVPMSHILNNVHEAAGTGTIFPDATGKPVLHMHVACGRNDSSITGCVRKGVKIWHILEVIIIEIKESTARRLKDSVTGFELLEP